MRYAVARVIGPGLGRSTEGRAWIVDLSAAAVERKTFDVVKRKGYDPDQVTAFLHQVADAIDRAEAHVSTLKVRLREVEGQLHDASRRADLASDSFVAVAEVKQVLLAEAERRAAAILAGAYEGALDPSEVSERVAAETSDLARAVFAGVAGEAVSPADHLGVAEADALLEAARRDADKMKAEARALMEHAEDLMADLQRRAAVADEQPSDAADAMLGEAESRAAAIVGRAREEAGHVGDDARRTAEEIIEKAKADAALVLERVAEEAAERLEQREASASTPEDVDGMLADLTAMRAQATALVEEASDTAARLEADARERAAGLVADAEDETARLLSDAREQAHVSTAASVAHAAHEVAEMRSEAAAMLEEARAEAAAIVARADDEAVDILDQAREDVALVSGDITRDEIADLISGARAEAAKVIADADQEAAAIVAAAHASKPEVNGSSGAAPTALEAVIAMRSALSDRGEAVPSDVEDSKAKLTRLLAEVRRMEATGQAARRAALRAEVAELKGLVESLEHRLSVSEDPEITVDLTDEATTGRRRPSSFYMDLDRPSRYQTRSAHLPHLGDDADGVQSSVQSLRKHMPDMGK